MNVNVEGRMYKSGANVYIGHMPIPVKDQRGKLYINYKGKQVNLKDIPQLPIPEKDYVFNYVFGGGSVTYPCTAMDYWIYRHRMGHRINTTDYIKKFNIKKRR